MGVFMDLSSPSHSFPLLFFYRRDKLEQCLIELLRGLPQVHSPHVGEVFNETDTVLSTTGIKNSE